jgi:hypothetical protein
MPPVSSDTLVPALADGVERSASPDGALRLTPPRPRRSWCGRMLLRLGWRERPPVELDDIGRFVVERFDGRTVARLADDLAAHLQLTRREAEAALGEFLGMLMRRRLIRLEAR